MRQVNFVRIPLFCWAPPNVSGLRFRWLYEGLLAENIVDGPRKRVIRAPPPDMVVSSPASVKKKRRQQSCEPSTSHGRTYGDPVNYYIDTDSSNHSSCSLDLRGKHIMLYSAVSMLFYKFRYIFIYNTANYVSKALFWAFMTCPVKP